jgi:soluble lytic murein transglycosylase-like protein
MGYSLNCAAVASYLGCERITSPRDPVMSALPRFLTIVFCCALPGVCAAEEGVFAFDGEDGAVHLSNVPDNPRYTLIVRPAGTEARGSLPAATGKPPAPAQEAQYKALIDRTAGSLGLDAALLHAVISVESGYNAAAVSKRGATGLMQLMPDTAKRYGVSNGLDPAQNIEGGARYLTDLMRLFNNDLDLVLAAYNAGENAVIRNGNRIPPYPETIAYVPKVVGYYRKYRSAM